MPEISDAELAMFKKLEAFHNSLMTHETEGLNFKQLMKRVYPKMSIPEIDAAAPHVAKLKEIEERLNKKEEDERNAKLESDFNRNFTETRREFDLTDEGMDNLKKFMIEKQIADPRAAAALLLHEKPPKPVEPSGYGAQRWDLLSGDTEAEQKSITDLINDPDAWLERQIPKIVAEERGNKRLPVGV